MTRADALPASRDCRAEGLPTEPWHYSSRSLAVRIFLTCWLVYALHLATNTVREIYLSLAIGDHFSFRVDEYANMHPDLFEHPGHGWHIGANPGASMIAAVPYVAARPIVDRVVAGVNRARAGGEPPEYRSPWAPARKFYREAWKRGLDVKFGIAAIVTQAFCMAPISAAGVVAMFFLLRRVFRSDRTACWLALLYAFGTPVFYRAGYLNHNMMLGHLAFLGFLAMWNPGAGSRWSTTGRYVAGGLAGGAALLLDYSGVIFLLGLFVYGLARAWKELPPSGVFRLAAYYVAGSILPVGLLWFYQWQSFGHFLYPGQHWMPPVQWIDVGYQGFGLPRFDLLWALAFDYRYGLFLSCPLFLLALAAPFANRGRNRLLPSRELGFLLGLSAALVLFCGAISYTRLQFNTGIRYLAPLFPFLFVPAAIVLTRLGSRAIFLVSAFSVVQAWSMAMYRDVERGFGLLDPLLRVFTGGFQLPSLMVLSRMGGQYGDYFSQGVSPLPVFLVVSLILFAIWSRRLARHTYSKEYWK